MVTKGISNQFKLPKAIGVNRARQKKVSNFNCEMKNVQLLEKSSTALNMSCTSFLETLNQVK
jgi:hypothetical protein